MDIDYNEYDHKEINSEKMDYDYEDEDKGKHGYSGDDECRYRDQDEDKDNIKDKYQNIYSEIEEMIHKYPDCKIFYLHHMSYFNINGRSHQYMGNIMNKYKSKDKLFEKINDQLVLNNIYYKILNVNHNIKKKFGEIQIIISLTLKC